MTLEQSATPTFANHQTFHPRFGWIKKGYDAAAANPNVFNLVEAPLELGVGKNMVEAIRFWSTATRVITRQPHPDKPRTSIFMPTRLGRALLDEDYGLDPYMEDPSTLWILHWQAISAESILPVWRLTFNDFSALEFTEADLLQYCVDEIAATTWSQPKISSIQKDVDCLLRMYSRRETRGRQTLDDLLDSPFRELQILQPSPGSRNSFRFVRGEKRSLSAAAITYACLDYMGREGRDSRTISVTRLAIDPGSPGRILKLSEQDIVGAIEQSARDATGIKLARPAGARQLAVESDPAHAALEVLWAHHSRRRTDLFGAETLDVSGTAARRPYPRDESGSVARKKGTSKKSDTGSTKGTAA
ncbi:DUF4007 family protein [Rhodococcus oxybenzonivorans]|uniref:DUF4007 family protein n=1 Tax=Rhodococcus oxybenzonivorans TaxID=1990687 RepID=UPI002954B17F|nr:DUF4007 family protein [Rhodococcus oxybenzonivorans]MDV7353466.1 DUF4007 family protein [Rhodococcus oxybenzonivorans]